MGSFLGGRSDRWEFWLYAALLTGASAVLPLLHIRVAAPALLAMWVVIWIRRLHDIDRSGWYAAAPIVLQGLCIAAGFMFGGIDFRNAAFDSQALQGAPMTAVGMNRLVEVSLIYVAIQYGFTIWLGLKPGTAGENRFGRAPHLPAAAAAEK